jgi:hypothetical protein
MLCPIEQVSVASGNDVGVPPPSRVSLWRTNWDKTTSSYSAASHCSPAYLWIEKRLLASTPRT